MIPLKTVTSTLPGVLVGSDGVRSGTERFQYYHKVNYMETSILDTRQRYSPINRASEKAEAARKAYRDAGDKYLADPTLANSEALTEAQKAMEAAEQLHAQAGTIWKHTEGKKRPAKGEYELTPHERGNGITDFTFKKRGQ